MKHSTKPNDATNIKPLDAIRQAEARVAGEAMLAEQEAEARRREARRQASQMVEQARQAGAQAGQSYREEAILAARQEAARLAAEAQARVDRIKTAAEPRVPAAARWALEVVLGLKNEELSQ